MRIGKWKRSQKTNGYYLKEQGKLPLFIFAVGVEHSGKRVYEIRRKQGLGDRPSQVIGYATTWNDAKKTMIQYMKHNPTNIII